MPSSNLSEVCRLFLRLGITAFGGPAAHIAMMHDEIVQRRKWVSEQEFLDLIGATNLIPGPNSTELAIHLAYRRAGMPGLIIGGACFILPAMCTVLALSWVYVRYGSAPQAEWLLYGVKPVVMAVIVKALWQLGQKAIKGAMLTVIGCAVLALSFCGLNEIMLLFAGGLLAMLILNVNRLHSRAASLLLIPPLAGAGGLVATTTAAAAPVTLTLVFLTFLKIGSVLYGSGYVLLAFLHADLVEHFAWMTDQQLIDAIAIGQVTPGPVFTTATFIGYVLAGFPGALLATLGIFLPAFIFVAISSPWIPKLRSSPWFGGLLDGVNVASLGLMAAVTWHLGVSSIIDPITAIAAIVSLVLLTRFKVNTTWLIAGGALVGVISGLLG